MNANIALSVAHAQNDHPLVFINKKFELLTQYSSQELIGVNCRLLQGSASHEHNTKSRQAIHEFLSTPEINNIRTSLVNYRKDKTPFINLLFMSKLTSSSGELKFIFASQFEISNSQSHLLDDYNNELRQTLRDINPILSESNIMSEGSLIAIANTSKSIAQAKLLLDDLEKNMNSF
ncbi:PAS domain-containing protein [Swingsia samuiensis]|uniref:PAS domain-containing protein n=2 Tax=Swingsia samuiensis TaxID=1293412 RepID=A0A4Y6UK94_9PROT|nr:PAS domain-containing protein [Swingsia samuiensis]